MGSTTKYKTRELCTVSIKTPDVDGNGTLLKYAFYTNIPDSARTKLGITTVALGTALPVNCVLGPSFPKPAKASKRFTDRSTSSFVSESAIAAARLDGWRVIRSRRLPRIHLGQNANDLVRTVYVTIKGIKYAWNIPTVSLGKIGEDGTLSLGIKYAVADDVSELCFGANYPKPPRASKTFGTTADDLSTVQTFYDPDKTLPDGWQKIDAGILTLTA